MEDSLMQKHKKNLNVRFDYCGEGSLPFSLQKPVDQKTRHLQKRTKGLYIQIQYICKSEQTIVH
jgi:hypothetical protein